MKKGDLLKHKRTGDYATLISDSFTKLFRDASDWAAMEAGGGDYATAATAWRIMYFDGGEERVLKHSTIRHNFEVIDEKTAENLKAEMACNGQ